MTEAPLVLLAEPEGFSPRALELLRARACVEARPLAPDDLADVLDECDALWFRLAFRIGEDQIGKGRRCRVLATPVTGIDHIDTRVCEQAGIEVVSLKGEVEFLKNVRATAELTVALTLALIRRIPQALASTRAGEWNRDPFRGTELYEKTVGIIGVGRLGSIVAGYFRAFGAKVVAYDIKDMPAGEIEMLTTLDSLLRISDVVSLHVDYNDGSRNLIGKQQLSLMKPGAVLVNTSRGGVIEESALLEALETRRLEGAALDVLTGEPNVDGSHPVMRYAREHGNLLLVPHIGGNTRESFEKTEVFLAGKVLEALERTGCRRRASS